MVYNWQFVPLDKEVYCVGFRYGRTKPIVNRKPTLGVVKNDSYWRRFVPDKENEYTIELRQYASSYYFADTYEEAVKKYNELVNVVYKKYYNLTYKIGQNFIGGAPR
jgi:hypothetical protein